MAFAMVSRREIVSGSSLTDVALVGMCRDYMVVNCILIIYRVVRPRGYSSARTLSRPLTSAAGVKNGDCHQFAPHHGPRSEPLGLKRIGWLYPIFPTVATAVTLDTAASA